jgi:glycosyltransferase involved in cell wall biosynthesis
MPSSEPVPIRPEVSIIVPARNEELSLGACLASLVSQKDVDFEIIVVDDGSSDRTREIALSFAGVQVIDPPSLRDGWTGKNNAVYAGARQAAGKWLLFTDADTVHLPGSLARSLAEARFTGADMLSYSPEQDVQSFWEKAVMPVIFAELASTYRPSEVSDPASPAAAANGQYLLISREAYDAVGGHRAVAREILEDVALARLVKCSGRKIHFRYAADAVRTRMYRNFHQLREGWTKNLALLFGGPDRLALRRAAEFLLITGTSTLTVGAALDRRPKTAAAAATIGALAYLFHRKRIAKAHFSGDSNLLALLGLPLFVYLLRRSTLSHTRGSVEWKGRTYGAPTASASSNESRADNPNQSADDAVYPVAVPFKASGM